jgi:membrane protein implicated in regulation of membrane protease activity
MESEAARSRAQALDEIWKWTVGGGILVMALAPLALPILILTIVALLPLALPLLAVGLLVLLIGLPIMLVRKLGRSVSRRGRRSRRPAEATERVEPAPEPATGH